MTYGYSSPHFLDLLKCMKKSKCMPEYPKVFFASNA